MVVGLGWVEGRSRPQAELERSWRAERAGGNPLVEYKVAIK